MTTEHRQIKLEQIRPSPTSAQSHRRKSFDKLKLEELAASIKTDGVINPIFVRPIAAHGKTAGHYELVAGERRYLASELAGLDSIPCVVRELDDEGVVRVQLIENLQREDLHPMHEAESYEELRTVHGYSVDEIWPEVGKSKAYVYGRLKLLALSKACRKAFYEGAVSASIAEKLARIPVEKLQDEALEEVLGNPHARERWQRRDPMSFRQALEHINEHYMLDLSAASFPIADEKLNGCVSCVVCPKRAGNAPDLFGDVKKGDTCTDPVCFAAKTRAYGQRQIAEAKAGGFETITGKDAKKIAPNGLGHHTLREGYHTWTDKVWDGRDYVAVPKLLKEGEKAAYLQDPKTGRTEPVVHAGQLKKAKAKAEAPSSYVKKRRDQAAHAKVETGVRRAVFAAIAAKGKWKAPPMRELVELVVDAMDYDGSKALLELLGVKETDKHDSLDKYVATLKNDEQLGNFLAQAYLGEELHVSSYSVSTKAPRLEAAAKAARVDVAKIRRELAPKKPKAKKRAKK